jgi:predicted enzyme related to lactoylglutathione lyase
MIPSKSIGAISWTDLTVPNAVEVKEFYEAVVGWTHLPSEMGGYQDFCMDKPGDGQTVAGICHARGENA